MQAINQTAHLGREIPRLSLKAVQWDVSSEQQRHLGVCFGGDLCKWNPQVSTFWSFIVSDK